MPELKTRRLGKKKKKKRLEGQVMESGELIGVLRGSIKKSFVAILVAVVVTCDKVTWNHTHYSHPNYVLDIVL